MPSPEQTEEFLRDCGARPGLAVEVEREGAAVPRRHVLDAPFALVGRDERNQLCLPDCEVSRRHAYLQALAGGVFWVDLGSRTGARCNGEARLAGWLLPANRLEVGPFTLRLAADVPGPAAPGGGPFDPLAADAGPSSDPPWALELPGGVRWRVNRPLALVGKSSRCKLRPNTPEASRFHCALVRAAAGVWVVDLLSSRGTYVNGERVPWALLREGDELRIGRVRLRLRGEASPLAGGVSVALGDGAGAACLSPEEAGPPVEGAAVPAGALLPRAPALPATASPELQEAILGPVINQFSLMQQQMLEQFHQTMVMMAQVFGNLHRDQLAVIREELTQLHQVTQELQALHVELARRPPAEGAGQEVPPPTEDGDRAQRGGDAEAAPSAPAPAPAPQPPPRPRPDRPSTRQGEAAETIHALLRQRLEALEAERKSRWDRILRFMRGR